MVFVFRVDIDSAYGLRNGVPRILELLSKLDFKASFFVVMGGETGILEILKQRNKAAGGIPGVKLPLWEITRILAAPYNFAEKHADILHDAIENGHEVGCHGWKHREWTRALDEIDIRHRFKEMSSVYEKMFASLPKLFTAPGFRTNLKVLECLDEFNYLCAGDLDGVRPFKPIVNERKFSHVQVPVTLKDKRTRPLIEGLCLDGYSDESIAKIITNEIKKQEHQSGFACFYCHDLFEGVTKLNLLEQVLTFVKNEDIETATMSEVARNCKNYLEVKL